MGKLVQVDFGVAPSRDNAIYIITRVVVVDGETKAQRKLFLPRIGWTGKKWHERSEEYMIALGRYILEGIR